MKLALLVALTIVTACVGQPIVAVVAASNNDRRVRIAAVR